LPVTKQPSAAAAARVARPRLAARLREGLAGGCVLITAGAGYGKTFILEEALSGTDAAWLSCTPADRDPGALLVRLIEAIHRAAPGAAGAFSERLAAAAGRIDPQAAARKLLAELHLLLVDPLVLVLDDAEELADAPGARSLLSELLGATGATLRAALASRRELGLRVAKARAAGRLTELGASELAFSAEESSELLGIAWGRDPDHDEIEALVSATEGWPLGVALLARAESASPVIRAASRADVRLRSAEHVNAFFAEQVLDPLDPAFRAALIDSSVCRRLTPAAVEALGLPGTFLDEIERAAIPARRPKAQELAYHPLFREFLLERLGAERDEKHRCRLHARVAPVLGPGEPIETIEHWLDAQEWQQAVATLQTAGSELTRTSPDLVRAWLDRMPSRHRADPAIRLIEGQLEWGAGNHPRAAKLLREAAAGARKSHQAAIEWTARFTLADSLLHVGGFEEAIGLAEGFDEPIAKEAGVLAPATAISAGVCMAAVGRFAESDRLAEGVRRHPLADLVSPVESIRLAFIDLPRGELDASIRRMSDELTRLEREDPFNFRLYLMASLAIVEDERGHRDRALELWRRICDLSGGLAPFMARHGRNWLALLHAQAGRPREAEDELARGGPAERGWRSYEYDVARAAVAALRGDAAEAVAAAENALATVRPGALVFRYWAAAHLAPVLVAVGERPRAYEAIADALALIDAHLAGGDGRLGRARLLALRAWLREADGDVDGADDDLSRAWAEAGESRRFVLRREWERLQPLIWTALGRGALDAEEAVSAIVRAFPEGTALVPFTAHPVAAVRRAALEPALASGHPDVARRLPELARDEDPRVAAAARRASEVRKHAVAPLRFEVLGGFAVRRGGWRAGERDWGRPAAARLVRYLLAQHGASVPEDAILEALWPELTPEGARRSLRVAASRARRVLELPGVERHALEVHRGACTLSLGERDSVDADDFELAARAALDERGAQRRALLERARSLWGGEPLPEDRYADWAVPWRERLTDLHIGVLDALAGLCSEAGEQPAAISVAGELVSLDPLHEGAHRSLMVAYARAGRPGHALRQYLECRRALVEGLGIEPAVETSRLQELILAGEPV